MEDVGGSQSALGKTKASVLAAPTASSRAPSVVKNEGGQEHRGLEDRQAGRDTAEPLASDIGSKFNKSIASWRTAKPTCRPREGISTARPRPRPILPPGDEELRRGEPGRPPTQPALLTSTGLFFPT